MRLLNCQTIQLEDFLEDAAPPYAILSHTWGLQEVVFDDIVRLTPEELEQTKTEGYAKIKGSCRQALLDKLGYCWVDTCCIDKSSSAELSEAINSMFRWYARSAICYAYLSDVATCHPFVEERDLLYGARWFSRGWTLRELLAPSRLVFFAADWSCVGKKSEMLPVLTELTGIDDYYLGQSDRQDAIAQPRSYRASVAERMSWAAHRVTTRPDDTAYCLLGLFGINMPLIYGEGGPRAFRRLQEEIMRGSPDMSLLTWSGLTSVSSRSMAHKAAAEGDREYQGDSAIRASSATVAPEWSFLADSPAAFEHSGQFVPVGHVESHSGLTKLRGRPWRRYADGSSLAATPFSITNLGLQISLPLIPGRHGLHYALLRCSTKTDPAAVVALEVTRCAGNRLYRGPWLGIKLVDHSLWESSPPESFFLYTGRATAASLASQWSVPPNAILVRCGQPQNYFAIKSISPKENIFTTTSAVISALKYSKTTDRGIVTMEVGILHEVTFNVLISRYSRAGRLHVLCYLYLGISPSEHARWTVGSYHHVKLSRTLITDGGVIFATVHRKTVFGVPTFVVNIQFAKRPPPRQWLDDKLPWARSARVEAKDGFTMKMPRKGSLRAPERWRVPYFFHLLRAALFTQIFGGFKGLFLVGMTLWGVFSSCVSWCFLARSHLCNENMLRPRHVTSGPSQSIRRTSSRTDPPDRSKPKGSYRHRGLGVQRITDRAPLRGRSS